ncbi:MAG: glycosyltransferase family 2 protein, partial [Anaerolineales bacterium]
MAQWKDRIVALIPAYNEHRAIEPVIRGTKQTLPVVVVDDGSSDGTDQVAEDAGAMVLRHQVNQGKGAALRTGFQWALEEQLRAVVTIDADGQHDPMEIPKFLVVFRSEAADLVIGKRDFSKMPFPRGYTNPFGSWLLSKVVGEKIYDNQSGYRLYARSLLEVIDFSAVGFEYEVEVIGAALRNDLKIAWVDIRTIYGTDTTSYFHPVRDSIEFLHTVWRARGWRRPG